MNTTASYTPLESLLLFQSLLQYGIEAAAFSQISQSLQNNSLIKGAKSYDAGRLSPESLQELFLHLLREELKSENDHAEKPDAAPSPNSKKRKLQAPPLPTLQDARAHVEKLPLLVDRLYARYRDHTVKEIREDEQRYEQLRQEISELDRDESEEQVKAKHESTAKPVTEDTGRPVVENGTPKAEDQKESKLPNGTGPPLPPQVQDSVPRTTASPRHPSPARQTPIPAPPTITQPPVAPPSQFGQAGTPIRPPEPSKSPKGAPPVLQPPQGVPSFSPRPASTTPQPIVPDGLQRPDTALKPKPPTPSPQVQPPVPGTRTLKWETPYQPQQPVAPQHQRPPQAGAQYPPQRVQPPPNWTGQPHLQYPSPQPLQPQPPQIPGQPASHQARPVLAQPQQAGQVPPTLQPAPIRPATESPGVAQQQRPPSGPPSVSPVPVQARPPQVPPQQRYPQPPQIPQGRGSGGVTPTPPPTIPAGSLPPQQWQQAANAGAQPPALQPQPVPSLAPASSAPPSVDAKQPHPIKPSHIPLPPHILTQQASTPGPSSKVRQTPILPQTPIALPSPLPVTQGSGTKWRTAQTPSTPHPGFGDVESPAFEMLSPVLQPAVPPSTAQSSSKKEPAKQAPKVDTSATKTTRSRASRSAQKAREAAETPVPEPSQRQRSPSATSHVDDQAEHGSAKVKLEEATPKPLDETGDTTADESLPSRRRIATPSRVSSRALNKRKRQDSVPVDNAPPSGAPTHVLWTRGFPRVSSSALDQIGSHRYANMFAHQIRERDAPGYRSIVLRPQDLKSIRTAIIAGNKAASAAAAALPDGDPGTISVWLPITEDITPPRGIINSAQLERELVHMFCNAIMYNPDPFRGPGPAFMRSAGGAKAGTDVHGHGGDVIGYQVDENSIVNDTRAMFVEVEKLLSDLRSTEAQPGAPPPALPPGAIPNSERLAGRGPHAIREPTATEDEGDDTTHTEAEGTGNTIKRRRIARG